VLSVLGGGQGLGLDDKAEEARDNDQTEPLWPLEKLQVGSTGKLYSSG
jgi:hypothetical protein